MLRRLIRKSILYSPFFAVGGLAGGLTIDNYYNHQRVQRNLRALYTAARIVYEYKVHWKPTNSFKQNEEVHRRCAKLVLNACRENGGLYIKFGQGIASMNHILPKPYREEFQVLHDAAPSVPYKDVRKIIIEDLKVDPNVIFSEFDPEPVASASIAQVHKAKLHSGETVAVKVQKPYIAAQVPWDLVCYRIMLHAFEYAFELPLIWSTDFTERQMLTEVDFVSEAMNSQKASQLLNNEKYIFNYPNKMLQSKEQDNVSFREDYTNKYIENSYLKDKVYVPKLYPSYCSKRILTAEWCDGVKVNDLKNIKKMGFKFSDIMHTVVSLFGYQIFVTGVVHCDPHPGNLLVRPKKNSYRNAYEIVFLDHGLYLEEPAKFRKEYSEFWTAMLLGDMNTLNTIGHQWGVRDVEFFASVQLIRPFSTTKGVVDTKTLTKLDVINMQLLAKKRAQKVLEHTKTIPRHLLFVGRNMNLVRANNKDLGSPVNRVGILAEFAAQGSSLKKEKGRFYYWNYRMIMCGVSMYYQWKSVWKSANDFVFGENSQVTSFEEDIEKQMEQFAKDMGLIIDGADKSMFDA